MDAWHHLERLVAWGERPGWSAQNHAAGEYIAQVFQAAGLAVEEQRFDCPAWEHTATRLAVNDEWLPAAANAFSRACDVVAPLTPMATLAELEAAELTGRIGLLYGPLTKDPLAAKGWFLKSERDERIVQLLEDKRPAALLTVQVGGELNRVIEDAEFAIPSAAVTPQVGLALRRHTGAVHLQIEAQLTAGYSANIVGRAGAAETRIVLCAHYDTKIDTPGANDNGAGAAALLALAQHLKPGAHSLEFIAFTNEEYLPIGDDEYLRRGEPTLGQIVAAINCDGIGQTLGANSITAITCAPAFVELLTQLMRRYPGLVWVEPWPQSNHSTFSWRGVPSLAFTTEGAPHLAHLRTDTIDWISPEKLDEVVAVIQDVANSLQDKSPAWTRGSAAA